MQATCIHITAQAGAGPNEIYSTTDIQHIDQLFLEESLLEDVYVLRPYSTHKATLPLGRLDLQLLMRKETVPC